MTGLRRLSEGGRIDRHRPVRFEFNGKNYAAFSGDTIASALLANGESLTARSFKLHRPRGIISAGIEEPGTIVELLDGDASANQPATIVQATDGLRIKSVGCWPSPKLDFGGINQLFASMLPAAFYYKTFFWPSWRLYEPLIRRAAGRAFAPRCPPDGGRYEARNWHCDVLVAGAGPAGLMAALTAARSGSRVLLADQGMEAGGSLLDQIVEIGGNSAEEWVADTVAELSAMENVVHLQNSLVWAYREHNLILVCERDLHREGILERNWRVRAKRVVIATGSTERMLVFPDNDRPGIMLASAVRSYVNRFAVRPGTRAVVVTNNDSAYSAIRDMLSAGIEVAAVVDSRESVSETVSRGTGGIELLSGHEIARVFGRRRVRGVSVMPIEGRGEQHIDCDLVAVSGGWNPSVQLWSQSRGALRYDEALAAFVPGKAAQPAVCAGAAAGDFTLEEAFMGGARVGANIIGEPELAHGMKIPAVDQEPPYRIQPIWHARSASVRPHSFVDILNDVTLQDLHIAMREGFRSVELMKRYTTAGMGMDQGRTGNMAVISAIADASRKSPGDVGVTTFRSPTAPVSFGSIAGIREASVALPYRHTPVTEWNIEQDAVMYEAGARWRRPGYFPRPGETMQDAVNREARAVRESVGVYDGSPLGTFEIKGKDAPRFLDMLYTSSFSELAVGQGRYGLMLSDDGLILDDGVSFRLGKYRYLASTSTAHADAVYRHMTKFLAIERPNWEVWIADLTSQWANATICGPLARKTLSALGTDIDISRKGFPFMALREGTVAGFPARVARVSFTGEVSFEINVRPRDMKALWAAVMEAGREFGITPVGSETSHVLRVEKGFLSTGHEVDGTVDPFDLGMGWVMSRKKSDFIGKRSVFLRRKSGKPRRRLVGLLTLDARRVLPEGAPITNGGRKEPTEGFVTASVWSAVNERSVALALLEDGRDQLGAEVHIRLPDEVIAATVTSPCFHDPEGKLLRG